MTTQRNGKAAAPHAPPLRVPGAVGRLVYLAGAPYHVAVLTTFGVKTIRDFLQAPEGPPTAALADASMGLMFVEGVMQQDAWPALRELLTRIVLEPLPEDVEYAATGDEIASVIDVFFDQSGVRFFELIAKNSATRAQAKWMERANAIADVAIDRALAQAETMALPPVTIEPVTVAPVTVALPPSAKLPGGTASPPISSSASS